jgi:hypothetical protein
VLQRTPSSQAAVVRDPGDSYPDRMDNSDYEL